MCGVTEVNYGDELSDFDAADLATALEEDFRISICDEIIDEWQNVGDVIDYIIVATIPEKAPKDVHDDGSARIL